MIDLKQIHHIAIVGLSPNPQKDSHKVAKFLQQKGFHIIPIYPKEEYILGEKVLRSIQELKDYPVDTIVIFRKSQTCKQITQAIIDLHHPNLHNIWLQLGIHNEEAKALALSNGLNFVQNKCIKLELERHNES